MHLVHGLLIAKEELPFVLVIVIEVLIFSLFSYILLRHLLALVHNLCLIPPLSLLFSFSIQQFFCLNIVSPSYPIYRSFEWFCYIVYIIAGIDMQLCF